MRVAVTGVGGGVGQSAMKALSVASLPVEVFPVDVQPLSAGLYRGAEGVVLPRPETPDAIPQWERWMLEKRIDALIPGSDHDLIPLARVRDDWASRKIGRVLVSDLDLVMTCRDKVKTCLRLQAEGLPVPRSAWDLPLEKAFECARQIGFPVVIKPRGGFASRGVHVVSDEEEFRFFHPRVVQPIIQEYLTLGSGTEEEEYTCAVFVDGDGQPVSTFMARRDLSGGTTYRAEVNFWPDIHDLLLAIGRALRPRGPLNVQLRRTRRGLVPFELNIRCSGTAAIRAHFGYNEPEMLLRHYVLGQTLQPPQVRSGYAFRYWNEVFLEGVTREELLRSSSHRGSIRAWP